MKRLALWRSAWVSLLLMLSLTIGMAIAAPDARANTSPGDYPEGCRLIFDSDRSNDCEEFGYSGQCYYKINCDNLDLSQKNFNYINFDEMATYDSPTHCNQLSLQRCYSAGESFLNTDLSGSSLRGLDLSNADLTGANLTGADFTGTDLTNTKLRHATLTDITLDRTRLSGVNLTGAKLQGISLTGAILAGDSTVPAADLVNANLKEADLSNASLNSVDFSRANLAGATFQNVNARDINFSQAILSGADFSQAKLYGVDFDGATLNNANFDGATLDKSQRYTNFQCSYLGGANLENSHISYAIFLDAVITLANNCKHDTSAPNDHFCGRDPFTTDVYGPTQLTSFGEYVYCPNGARANCNSNQLSFPNWTTSNCGSRNIRWFPTNQPSSGHTVNISDPYFKRCIAQQMYNDPTHEIDINDARALRAISCPSKTINNADGLDRFPNVERLDLSGNNFKGDLDLSKNGKLVNLNLENNGLTAVTVSANSNNTLVDLNLSHNKLSTFALGGRRVLNSADLSYNNLKSVDLSRDENLVTLFLQHNPGLTTIQNISSLLYKSSDPDNSGFLNTLSVDGDRVRCSSLVDTDLNDYPAVKNSGCSKAK